MIVCFLLRTLQQVCRTLPPAFGPSCFLAAPIESIQYSLSLNEGVMRSGVGCQQRSVRLTCQLLEAVAAILGITCLNHPDQEMPQESCTGPLPIERCDGIAVAFLPRPECPFWTS